MPEIPLLKETQPVLNVQTVESGAEGYEAFARTLGSIGKQAAAKTEELVTEQSQAQLLKSSAQAETIKTNAQIEMTKHPDQADTILSGTAQSLDKLNQTAFVNSKDRGRLAFSNSQDFNQLRLKAATVTFQQSQVDAANNFWDSYPVTNKQIQDAVQVGDFKKAKMLEDALHQTSLNLAHIGAITPTQYANIRKVNFEHYSRIEDALKMSQNPDGHSAAEYHAVMASPFDSGNFGNVNYPSDSNTQWMSNHYNDDQSFKGQLVAMYNDQPYNWGALMKATPAQYNDFKSQMMGVNTIKGAFQANGNFHEIDSHIKSLEAQPKLTDNQVGQVNYWKSLKNRFKTDNGFYQLMNQTVIGGQNAQEYNAQSVSIMNSSGTSQEKFEAMRENDNNYIGKSIALAHSMNLDHDLFQPIPAPFVSDITRLVLSPSDSVNVFDLATPSDV